MHLIRIAALPEINMQFVDRTEAGGKLGARLAEYAGRSVVYALPRGGVVVGFEVAARLRAPLDLILVRKLGHPYQPEYAIGAIAEGGEPVLNQQEVAPLGHEWVGRIERDAVVENARRRREYFPGDYAPPVVENKVAVLVDDGIATGLTMRAAALAVRRRKPERIVVAVPVAPSSSLAYLDDVADELLVLDDPDDFMGAVGLHYRNFPQVEDDEVIQLLQRAKQLLGEVA
jgi:predicted phosphoribosyltransferase